MAFPSFRPPAQLGAEDTWERGGNKSHMFPSGSDAALHGLFSEPSPFRRGRKTLIVVDLLVCNNFQRGDIKKQLIHGSAIGGGRWGAWSPGGPAGSAGVTWKENQKLS